MEAFIISARVNRACDTNAILMPIALESAGGQVSGAGAGCDEEFEFAFTLDLLLEAFQRPHRAGWSSRDRPDEN